MTLQSIYGHGIGMLRCLSFPKQTTPGSRLTITHLQPWNWWGAQEEQQPIDGVKPSRCAMTISVCGFGKSYVSTSHWTRSQVLSCERIHKYFSFGLARTALDEGDKHISTHVMGTFGYVAPEYAMIGHLLVKSDFYIYGVVLLELLTGRKPVDMSQPAGQVNLVSWARLLLTRKEGLEAIIDPALGSDIPFENVAKVGAIASMCVQPEVSHRPFMGEVVQALKLVCNENEETAPDASTSCSQDELPVPNVVEMPSSDQHQSAEPRTYLPVRYSSGLDIERGLSASEIFSSSARYIDQDSGSFRRHSASGPLRSGRSSNFLKRSFSRLSVSEHGLAFKLWRRSDADRRW